VLHDKCVFELSLLRHGITSHARILSHHFESFNIAQVQV